MEDPLAGSAAKSITASGGSGEAPSTGGTMNNAGQSSTGGSSTADGSGGMDTGGASTESPSGGGGNAAVDTPSTGAGCKAPASIGICDPVQNSGCSMELGMQCAADLIAPTPTGYCTFSAENSTPPGPCLNTGVTESCPPTETCHQGECRSLCFCDSDCPMGLCCSEPLGTSAFSICGDC